MNPELKILVCLGIINEIQKHRMIRLMSNPIAQATFNSSAMTFFGKYEVDGMDIDFWFPTNYQIQNFTNFLLHMRETFSSIHILTVVASTNEWRTYDVSGIASSSFTLGRKQLAMKYIQIKKSTAE